jgi:cytochrome c-type biogenesis protein CcmF
MIPELGSFALILALCIACLQAFLPLAGTLGAEGAPRSLRQRRWIALARPAAAAQAAFVTLAFAILVHAFIANDFSVAYVAANSNTALPLIYRITATWGGHEGSLLLWVQVLALWTIAVAAFSRSLPDEFVARVLSVLGFVSIGFLCFMLFTSNPFDRLPTPPLDGRDLNPLLQDIGMIVHPPLLYMGYVGFSVAFAFSIAALIGGKLDAAWARWARPWTLVAWTFLTLGIFLGSFWAYYELGWGGWWFWDAVENASFMPWLVGTALVHSLAVTEKRGVFRSWTVLLAILSFSLSLLGTFLVRSGVLTSVHAFAADPRRGLFILVFLALVIGGSLVLYAWRAPAIGASDTAQFAPQFSLFSRESLLLVNNVLLLVAAATVLLGTLYPLFLDALGWGKISVGPPYFDTVFVPLMWPVLLLMAVGPFAAWKNASVAQVARRLRPAALAAIVTGAAIALLVHASPAVAVGLVLAAWTLLATLQHLVQGLRHAPAGTPLAQRLRRQGMAYWGMIVAHAGVGIFVTGVALVKGAETADDVSLRVGASAQAGDYAFRFVSLEKTRAGNYVGVRATFAVTKNGAPVATLHPEKRFYTVQQMPTTEAAIDRGFVRDLYVSLGERLPSGAWIVRVQNKPFMGWIWGGALIIGFGGFLAALDRRYRGRRAATVIAPAAPATASATASTFSESSV